MQSSVRVSQETHYISATKPNRLMLFREIIAVYCENQTEHIIHCVGKEQYSYIKLGGIYNYHCAFVPRQCSCSECALGTAAPQSDRHALCQISRGSPCFSTGGKK
jgi:hypothetical protein